MDFKTLRAAAICGVPLVRQLGIRITSDQIEEQCARDQLRSSSDLKSIFENYGVSAQFVKPSKLGLKLSPTTARVLL